MNRTLRRAKARMDRDKATALSLPGHLSGLVDGLDAFKEAVAEMALVYRHGKVTPEQHAASQGLSEIALAARAAIEPLATAATEALEMIRLLDEARARYDG